MSFLNAEIYNDFSKLIKFFCDFRSLRANLQEIRRVATVRQLQVWAEILQSLFKLALDMIVMFTSPPPWCSVCRRKGLASYNFLSALIFLPLITAYVCAAHSFCNFHMRRFLAIDREFMIKIKGHRDEKEQTLVSA